MAETTAIEWCDGTLNFWIGCTEVSNGPKGACTNCYARTWANRFPLYRGTWGPSAPRHKTAGALAKAMKMERIALKTGRPYFCFSNSLGDIFDNQVPIEWLREAFEVMRATPHVTYLLLTKRPQNIVKRSLSAGSLPPNAAVGATMVTQFEYDRDAPVLAQARALLNPRFTFGSFEPMQGPVILDDYAPDQIIVGGESGADARAMDLDWARSMLRQAGELGRVFNFKQVGGRGSDKGGHTLDGVTHFDRPVIA